MNQIAKPLASMKQSYERALTQKETVTPKTLNVALLSNPFLKDQEHYRVFQFEMAQYNKRISQKKVTDHYEVRCFEKMYLMICDLANMESAEDMKFQLGEIWNWWTERRRIIRQRQEQGPVKYKIDKTLEKAKAMREKMKNADIEGPPSTLPNDIRFANIFPYEMDYRTAHKQFDVPLKRVSEYKRKVIQIIDHQYLEDDTLNGKDRVHYPRPKKYVPPLEETHGQDNPQAKLVDVQEMEANAAVPNPQESAMPVVEPKPENQIPQNMEGFGQEPQPEEEAQNEEAPQQDKLAPTNKIYTTSIRQKQQQQGIKRYQKPYLFHRAIDDRIERRMEQRAMRRMQYSLQIQREEQQFVQKSHEWAKEKSKVDKYSQNRLQKMVTKHNYSFSLQDPKKQQVIAVNDEKKYGFYVPPKMRDIEPIYFQGMLPQIINKPLEKQLRMDRLKSLKHKFSTLLSLQENSELRQSKDQSLCQVSPKYRNFSMILEEHSREKEKLVELQQIRKIKDSLGKQRISINMRALSHALVPDQEESTVKTFQSPSNQLPSNPFFVEIKKKKKK